MHQTNQSLYAEYTNNPEQVPRDESNSKGGSVKKVNITFNTKSETSTYIDHLTNNVSVTLK
jgi:hypothetical protein